MNDNNPDRIPTRRVWMEEPVSYPEEGLSLFEGALLAAIAGLALFMAFAGSA